jgi:nucleoside-diphosphate-sugar epimerase
MFQRGLSLNIFAGGLVGARLVTKLVDQTEFHVSPTEKLPLKEIILFDMNDKGIPQRSKSDNRFTVHIGDLTDKDSVMKALDETGFTRVTVIHLAALLSGNSEDNFDLGMKINLFGTINVMECLREVGKRLGGPQTYLYTSTDYVACFNDYNRTHPVSEESFRLSPVSYGCQKACCELLVCDYTRKGFIDGRVGRLSAVIGRPGFSNSISYPYTGIFTQPLEGKDYDVPLPMEV